MRLRHSCRPHERPGWPRKQRRRRIPPHCMAQDNRLALLLTKRERVLGKDLGVRPHEIIATSGGTEANALAVFASLAAWRRVTEDACEQEARTPEIIVATLEHSSLQRPTTASELIGEARQIPLPATADGLVDLAALPAVVTGNGLGVLSIC